LKEKIEALNCVFEHRVSEGGKLFGSVTTADIAAKLNEADLDIDRKKIQLGEPIKTLGEFEVPIRLQGSVTANIKVSVVAAE
jgi:large subunit ribosomal protein L9